MKAIILAILAAALCACADDKAYWQARQAAVYQLPREQRAAAQIELMREQHNEQQIHQQQAVDTANATVTPVVAGATAAILTRALCGW